MVIELQLSRDKPSTDSSDDRCKRNLRVLQDAHGERLHRFCLRLCGGSAADADDLMQETWVAAYQSLPRFQNRAKVTTWLFRIAVYRWRQMRASSPSLTPLGDTDDTSNTPSTPDTAPSTLNRLALADALLTLSDAQREAFLLVKAEQFTHKEAAQILNVPQGTVQARVHEAVRRLRVALSSPEETDVQ